MRRSPLRPEEVPPLDTVRVVSHTHWDREWYHGATRFRQRLVALVDALLADPGPGPFLLDGQAVVVRDYLTVRPDRAVALSTALQTARLEAGPWYVLADGLIPSGEAIIRNLEAGRRVLAAWGATAPRVAYCPDTFGHPAAMPVIAMGFGLPVGIVWRGAGGPGHPRGDVFWWEGPDGTRLLTHHLPPDGYEFGSALPAEAGAAQARWDRLRALFASRATTGLALLLNGADHHARQPDLRDALAQLQAAAGHAVRVVPGSLQDWAEDLANRAATAAIPAVAGELRNSYGYTWTLGGTLATRAHQKRRNARLERGLLRDVEPWLALVRLQDRDGTREAVDPRARLTMAQLPALLHRTWEDLLETHPHDTLCGCSTDEVARALDARQEAVADQGRGLREAALQLLLAHDPVAARAYPPHGVASCLVLRNRAPRVRAGVALVTVREFLADVPVGPGSAGQSPPALAPDRAPPRLGAWTVQPVAAPRLAWSRRESPQHYPDNDAVAEHRLLAWVPPVPALGVAALDAARAVVASPPSPVIVHDHGHVADLDNGLIHVAVEADGLVTIVTGDRRLHGALSLVTASDAGDSYTPMPLTEQRFTATTVRVVEPGPLRGAIAIDWRAPQGAGGSTDSGPVRVTTTVRLSAGGRWVECDVQGVNARTNHRLRLVWHTDVDHGDVTADAALGPVRRPPIVAPAGSREQVPDGQPLHRWITWANGHVGATLISDGLAEAHVAGGAMAITLLRAVGELSKGAIAARPGHAGWPVATPDAQCRGPFRARCALLLHGPLDAATLAHIRDVCDDVLVPLIGETWMDLDLPADGRTVAGVRLIGEAFELSAVTVAQHDPRAVILRAVNLTEAEADGAWELPDDGPWIAERVRLDETGLGDAHRCARVLPFRTGARAVETWRVRRADR